VGEINWLYSLAWLARRSGGLRFVSQAVARMRPDLVRADFSFPMEFNRWQRKNWITFF
jgi:hypothetical protein